MRSRPLIISIAIAVALTACGEDTAETPETVRLITHESFAGGVEGHFDAFTADTGMEVEVISSADAGTLVNQVVISKENPLADVLFGVDDTFLSRAVDEGVFAPHTSSLIDQVDPELRHPDDLVTPIDFGDVCFNYDKDWFAGSDLAVPEDLETLTRPEYAELVTVEHPATSSPGLAFMLATIVEYGEDGWLDWWERMRDGGVNVAPDWDTAYYGDFTRYGGSSPIVLSYASSPPAEVIFAEEPLDEAPTGVIEAGCYRQVEYAGVLDGTPYPEAAGSLIDYMLSVEFQNQIPLSWFVFPVNSSAELPSEFVEHTVIPEDPHRMSSETIASNRDAWIDQWVQVMQG